jgi:ribose 5-phosphate isomerase A
MNEDTIAEFIAKHVKEDMVVALGTGDFEEHFVKKLALHVEEHNHKIKFIPTSMKLASLAAQLQLPITNINDHEVDLAVEMVDLIDKNYNYIDNNSFSLVREKMIAQSAAELTIIAKKENFGPRLHGPIAFEITPFGWKRTLVQLEQLGPATLRKTNGKVFKTESDNYLADVQVDGIVSMEDLNYQAKEIPGVIETGLFIGYADRVLLYDEKGGLESRSRMTNK